MTDQQCVLVFDGQDDCVNLGKKPEFKVQSNITIEAWIYAAEQKEWAAILSNIFDTGLTESGYGLLLDGKSGIYFGLEPSSQGSEHLPYLSSGANTLNLNQWHHIAGSYDGQQMKVYVDGVEKATKAIASDSINYNNENDLLIGMYKDDNEFYAFKGKIAEVRLWNRARSQAELQQDMHHRLTGNESGLVGYWPLNECSGNTITDKTEKGNNGTINGATWQQEELPVQAKTSQLIKQGPQGSTVKGTSFDIQPKTEAARTRIKSVRVKAAWAVDSIQVQYETLGTTPAEIYLSPACGGSGGNLIEFSLDPDDYLTEVIGSWGTGAPGYPKQEIVTLQFKTQKGILSSVMGGGNANKQVEPFSLKAPPGYEIIGFFGEHGNTLHNLGIYLQKVSATTKVGPKGGSIAGKDFDFQPKDAASRLKKVGVLAYWAINGLEVEYENPTSNPPETYHLGPVGNVGDQKLEVGISIEPGDYLTKISGTWGRSAPGYHKEDIITLQFETHKGVKSQVFGGGSGKSETEPFVLEAPEGYEIIGLFGTHGGSQDLIIRLGIYCQPVQQPVTPQPITTDEGDPEEVVEEFVGGEKTGTATGTVAIADISYKGKVKRTQSDEYVEIVNKGTAAVDISGWKVSSGLSKRQSFTFPAGTTLEAGKSFRIYTNEVHPETGGFSLGSGTGIWNDKGDEAKLFDAQGNQVSTLAYGASGIPGIKAELGVPQLTVKVSPSAINKQMAMGSQVTFVDALQLAIRSFLEDDSQIESPLGQILNDPGAYGLPEGVDKAAATKMLRSYLNQPTSTLTLQTAKSQYPPENGEKVDANWIFLLQIKEMSGLYWVIIDRSGAKAPYNYGVS